MKTEYTAACPTGRPHARRVLTALVAGALALGPLTAPVAAAADTADDLSAQVEAAQKELADLTYRLELAQAEADTTALDLADTQERISALEDEVAQTASALETAQAELSDQAVQSYKAGNVTLVDIIFSSASFDELSSRLFYANKVARAAEEQVSSVRELQESLAAQRDELAAREDELSGLLSEQTSDAAALEAARTETSRYVNGLSAELSAALAAERAAAAEEVQESAPSAPAGGQQTDQGSTGGAQEPSQPSGPAGGSQAPSGGQTGGGQTAGSGSLSSAQRSTIVSTARSQLGCAYDYGAMTPGMAFDCSGLTTYCYRSAGVSIPRSSATQYRTVKNAGNLKTDASQLVAGDLVFYQTGGTIRHVAIYIGGNQVIHASDYSTGVITSSIYYSPGFCGGGSPV